MALRDLGVWLLEVKGFRRRLNDVVVDAACKELESGGVFQRNVDYREFSHEWGYLLLCASVLAQADEARCHAVALRLAQTCLADEVTDAQRDSAALVLDALANHPAINLAVDRKVLRPSFEDRLPRSARIEHFRRSYEQSIQLLDERSLRVNRFQKDLWDKAQKQGWLSVSAPTSAGKSFILSRWIRELVHTRRDATVVYVVPTRALIGQVERDLRDVFGEAKLDVSVSSIPKSDTKQSIPKRVFVLTQERLHILLVAEPNLTVHALIVDEAHKVGDRHRGVLLQDVVERLSAVNPGLRVLFASPMTSNPEILLDDAGSGVVTDTLSSEEVTVSQNLFWVTQRPRTPKSWQVSLRNRDQETVLGLIQLDSSPTPVSKRLPFIAHAIGGTAPGNVVYVNGAAEAEKVSAQLYGLVGEDVDSEEITSLIELARHVVHPEFALATFLRRGVAFHYGSMPLLIREEIERLFSAGLIVYLVCTSTLIEGVNMSCRNIFMRGPRKGVGNHLTAEDFWNLAGRAGRWGKEFQGNIVCVDTNAKDVWGDEGPPRERKLQPIRRATDDVLRDPAALSQFIQSGAPSDTKHPELRYVFSYLAGVHIRHGGLLAAPWASRHANPETADLADLVEETLAALSVHPETITNNPGISPLALDGLLESFRERTGPVEELLPADPASPDAVETYTKIFQRLCVDACPGLGPPGGRAFVLALLVTRWMCGIPLSRLIQARIKYLKKKGTQFKLPTEIRSVMTDVEQIARFEAPRAMSCYCDVLRQHLVEIGRSDLLKEVPQLALFLELGVNQQTQIALIGVGLSRTSTIAVSELITEDSLSEAQALSWLVENENVWGAVSSIPVLVKKEIERVLVQHRMRK